MRISTYPPTLIREPAFKAQPAVRQAQRGRSNFLDSVSLTAPDGSSKQAVSLPAATSRQPLSVARQSIVPSIGRPILVSAKIPAAASDTSVAPAPPAPTEPSAVARLFGYSSSTPTAPAPLQTQTISPVDRTRQEPRTEVNLSTDSIAALSSALHNSGIDPTSLGLQYSDQPVYYPGGFYSNKLITATMNGETHQFGADLVLKNPEITTTEILRFLGRSV